MASAVPMESALLLVVPEAEPVVGEHRTRLDLAARVGVPAHITVLYPFAPLDVLTPDDLGRLRDLFAATDPFTVDLRSTGWFGDDVLFLAPADPAPIVGLTRRVEAAFPDHPIYGGAFDDIQPHLTVGHAGGVETLRQAEVAVAPLLPVTHEATAVQLWSGPALATQRPGWRRAETFVLGE